MLFEVIYQPFHQTLYFSVRFKYFLFFILHFTLPRN